MFFPATAHFLAFLVSTLAQAMPQQGPICPAGPQAPISVLETLHPTTGICTPSFVFSSMLLKNPFQSPSNRCLISPPQHMDLPNLPTPTTTLQMANLLKYFLKLFIFLSKPD